MTQQIMKSQITGFPDFAGAAAAHAVEMRDWRAHMERVRADEAAGITGIEKHHPLKRPIAHPLVEAAVNERDEADFEIGDDGPTEDQILAARKYELLLQVTRLEQEALAAVVPIGKRRLFNFRETDIRSADSELAQQLHSGDGGILNAIASKVGLVRKMSPDKVAAAVEEARPQEDTEHLEQQAARRARTEVIVRAAAQAMHDIEDLTTDTIGAWVAPDFMS